MFLSITVLFLEILSFDFVFGADSQKTIVYRPVGVQTWKRIANHVAYDFPPDNDGFPSSIYRGDLSRYPSDALNSNPPYGQTMDIENGAEIFSEDYHNHQFATFIKAGDEHFAENITDCNDTKDDLLYGVFRVEQVYVNRGMGFALPPPNLCKSDNRLKRLYRIDSPRIAGQSFLHTLKLIADDLLTNKTSKNPKISFDRSKRDGFVHPIAAFMADGMHERIYDLNDNFVSDYARMQNGKLFFAYREMQESDRFAYSHATFLWTAEEFTTDSTGKTIVKQIPLPFIYNVDFLLNGPTNSSVSTITSQDMMDSMNYKIKRISRGGVRLELKWDEWSCCSACCCEEVECGNLYASNCYDIESYRRRRGLYSFHKVNDAELRKDDTEGVADLFDVKLYRTQGIPVTSSIWKIFPKMWQRFDTLFELSNKKMDDVWKQFFQIMDCAKEKQKLNCTEWDLCRGIHREYVLSDQNQSIDPCYGLDIKVIKVKADNKEVQIEEGSIYRIIVDFDTYQQEPMEVTWTREAQRIVDLGGDDSCERLQQLYRHPNKRDLLVPSLAHLKESIYVNARWDEGQKDLQVMITLKKQRKEAKGATGKIVVIVGLISGYILLICCLCFLSCCAEKYYEKARKNETDTDETDN